MFPYFLPSISSKHLNFIWKKDSFHQSLHVSADSWSEKLSSPRYSQDISIHGGHIAQQIQLLPVKTRPRDLWGAPVMSKPRVVGRSFESCWLQGETSKDHRFSGESRRCLMRFKSGASSPFHLLVIFLWQFLCCHSLHCIVGGPTVIEVSTCYRGALVDLQWCLGLMVGSYQLIKVIYFKCLC